MPKLVLIRHGESLWNGERRIQGNQDPPLSPRGLRQADRLVARMQAQRPGRVAAIYTSPLRRAAETAERLAAALRLPLVGEPDLREMSLGRWEGLTVPEIQAAFPGAYERWLENPAASPAPGGEALPDFARRVVRALTCMQEAQPGADLILVTHGGVVKALLCHVLGLDVRYLFRLKQDNTAVSLIQLEETDRRVLLVNDTCHLSEGGEDLMARDVLTDAGETPDPAV
jgi:broad specificity phosphatase PhoE